MNLAVQRGNTKDRKFIRYKYELTLSHNVVASGEVLTSKKNLEWREILKLIAESSPEKENKWKKQHF